MRAHLLSSAPLAAVVFSLATILCAQEPAPGPAAPLRLGHVHLVTQPRRRPTSYTVEDLVDGRSFSWASGNQAMRQQADHEVVLAGEGCFVTLSFEMSGTLGNLLSNLAASRIRSFVDTEAASLKARCEHVG